MYVAIRQEQKYRRRRQVVAMLAVLAGLALGVLTMVVFPGPDAGSLPEAVRCEEDQSCWDCENMGNGYCGPVTIVKQGGKDYLMDAHGKILGEISEP